MKLYLKNFIAVIAASVLLWGICLLLYMGAASFSDILSSKKTSVNTSDAKKSITVVLDAGHGGVDGGAVGVSGSLEKHLNLAIAKKTATFLEDRGYTVVLTREEDELLTDGGNGSRKQQDLRARVNTVEKYENAVLVSIHMNRFPKESVQGITFYYSPNHPDSYRLSEAMRQRMLATLQPDNRRPMKEATSSIYVLYHTTVPAVLVECGFLSNRLEEAKLAEDAYQLAIAEMIGNGIVDFFEKSEDVS